MADLDDVQWWRDLAERLVRNLLQAMSPSLILLAASGNLPDLVGTLTMLFVVFVYTLGKYLMALTADPDSPWYVQIADRVVSAGAAGALTMIPSGWTGTLGSVMWGQVGYAALGSMGMALVMLYGVPPTQATSRAERGIEWPEDEEPKHRA